MPFYSQLQAARVGLKVGSYLVKFDPQLTAKKILEGIIRPNFKATNWSAVRVIFKGLGTLAQAFTGLSQSQILTFIFTVYLMRIA